MNTFKLITSAVAALSISAAFAQGATAAQPKAPALKEGAKAPALAVAKWVKGKPVPKFEKGKIYVVEFWATWCGPCKTSIPHITEMAKKYAGKVSFNGISVWENKRDNKDTSYYATVEKFVKDMGTKMNYNIAIDGPAGAVSDAWMKASGQNGIPTAFIVGKDGTIAWIGHPMDGLEETLDQIIAGKFDPKANAKKRAEAAALEAEMEAAFNDLSLAMGTQDYDKVSDIYRKLSAKMPTGKAQICASIYSAIWDQNREEALKFAKSFQADFDKDAMALNEVAWSIVEVNDATKEDYMYACSLAEKAAKIRDKDYAILDTYAYALFRCGDKAKAIEVQTKAVELADKDAAADAELKKELKERLELFKKS
ncbi:MAG: redoxin domain-containing protein [Chthonomonas sp.]|nr:redoxin domain-containing protein [Chthonomonas sp.]